MPGMRSGRIVDLHLLMGADDGGELGLRQGAAEALEDDLQPLADGPGDVLVMPDPVEGGVADVIGQGDPVRLDRGLAIEGPPQQMATLGLLGAQALGLALGLVGIVVDDGIPEIEGDGFELGRQERPLFLRAGPEASGRVGGRQPRVRDRRIDPPASHVRNLLAAGAV